MGRGRDLVGLHRDGTEIPVEVALSTVETAQGPSFLAGVIDISARKGLELELRQANANLEEFTYVASHDLRSPLRGLADLFQWISDDIADLDRPSVSKNLERARIRVERLERIIEDLLTYARSARTSYDYDDIEVGKLIARMIELQPRPADFSINVHCEVDSIRAIRAPLETVLRNLVSNAVKHHDRGDGCIDISVALDDTYCIFTVSDDGPGIPKEFMGRVFKLFQTMTSTERGGTGLGLAVTKRLVERHGGQITLDSEGSTRGATFRVRWPRFPRKMNDDQPSA
jgi:signal transduction histidine kinase